MVAGMKDVAGCFRGDRPGRQIADSPARRIGKSATGMIEPLAAHARIYARTGCTARRTQVSASAASGRERNAGVSG
jgi:hypothetical protein